MKKFLCYCLVFMFSVGIVLAVDYTFSTNVPQEARLTRLRTLLNAHGSSYANNQALVNDVCGSNLLQMYNDQEAKDFASWVEVIRSLSQAQRDTLCTQAGGTLTNGRCVKP